MPAFTSSPLGARRLYLAVDCGGSKAAAAIAISSSHRDQPPSFLSRGFGGAANYTDVGLERFLNSVRRAVEAALDASRIEWRSLARRHHVDERTGVEGPPDGYSFPPIFQAAWFGIAGVDSPLNISVLSPHLSRLLNIPYPSPRLIVANDTSLLASPVIERDDGLAPDAIREGVVCIAGTGSIVMSFRSGQTDLNHDVSAASPASASSGRLLEAVGRVGGFGWLLGDEGGGFMVGKRAVRAVLDQADRERLEQDGNDQCESAGASSSIAGNGVQVLPSSSTLLQAQGQPNDRAHLLRDRILAHWSLRSTDDLLDTVYSNEVILQPSKPDSYGAHRASTSSASSSVQGHGGGYQESGQSSTRSSFSIDSREGHGRDTQEDRTPSASLYQDLSQRLIPPGARQDDCGQVSGAAAAAAAGDSSSAVTRNGIPSPIPAIDSYPPSPGKQSGMDASSDASRLRDQQHQIEAADLDRALDSGDEQGAKMIPTLPTIAHPEPTLTTPALSSSADVAQETEPQNALGVRKLRLASLAPLVFHLAFTHQDSMSLSILRGEIRLIADQIQLLLQRERTPAAQHNFPSARTATLNPRRVLPSRCTLCLGGSLLGVEGYRNILVEELRSRGWEFRNVVHVEDVARRGCEALAKGWEGGGSGGGGAGSV